MPDNSVTHWLGKLKAGDPAGAEPIWNRYFPRLVELARARLRGFPRRGADEEDIALSAFDSFCRDADLKTLAVWKMEGYTNEEIAVRWGCVLRTVERRLRVIRSLWAGEVES